MPSRTRSSYVIKVMAWQPWRRLGCGIGFGISCHAWRRRQWLEWMIARFRGPVGFALPTSILCLDSSNGFHECLKDQKCRISADTSTICTSVSIIHIRQKERKRSSFLERRSRNIARHKTTAAGILKADNYASWHDRICKSLRVWVVYIPRESMAF